MEIIIRRASVRWKGSLKGGTRWFITGNGRRKESKLLLPLAHSSNSDPTELIAAAHASSFSLALSDELKLKPFLAGEIVTTATVTVERVDASPRITNIHLNVIARLPNVTQKRFLDAALRAKNNCLATKSLPPDISISAKLENGNKACPDSVTNTKSTFEIRGQPSSNLQNLNSQCETATSQPTLRYVPSWNGHPAR
jgi:lipoyl-dependent peroxiredoxin